MNFNEIYNSVKGWLQIFKIEDGNTLLIFDDSNVVCSGLGATLASMFSATGVSVSSYQINLVQVGASGSSSIEVSTLGAVSGPLTTYAGTSYNVISGTIVASGTELTDKVFLNIPQAYVDRVGSTSVRWTISLDENTANGNTLNEIGLYSNNPFETSPRKVYLCNYKYFGDIVKTNKFALLFKWTVEF